MGFIDRLVEKSKTFTGATTPEQIRSEKISRAMKIRNLTKHVRIAHATKGHEQAVHLERVAKLARKYGFK